MRGIGSKQNTGVSKADSESSHIWLKTKLRIDSEILRIDPESLERESRCIDFFSPTPSFYVAVLVVLSGFWLVACLQIVKRAYSQFYNFFWFVDMVEVTPSMKVCSIIANFIRHRFLFFFFFF